MCQFLGKTDNLEFFGSNLPKYWILGSEFQKFNSDSELAPPRNRLYQFSAKVDNFEISGPNFGKLLNYVRYFSSNNVEDIAESSVEVDGAGCTVK